MSSKAESTEGIILNYLNEHNRPLNVQNVADALQKYGIKKAAVQKVLDTLADSGKISFKEYGKQKIYLARQDQFQIPSPQELQDLQARNEKLQKQLEAEKSSLAALEAELRDLESNLTLEQIKERQEKLQNEIATMEAKLCKLREGAVLVDAEERKKVEATFTKMVEEWRKRKRMFKELWDVITEALPKDPKEFREELGIELDEDVQVNIQDYCNLLPKKRKR